jgi:hypothetical protein
MGTVNDDYPKAKKQMSDADLKAKAIAQYQAQEVVSKKTDAGKFPTEIIQLPSGGKLYPEGHPLASGTVEMKYMTAREEDILTNQSYIKQGVVLDKLFQSLLVTEFDYNDILVGDKNAIMIAARVLGYGKEYEFEATGPSGTKQTITADLTKLGEKDVDTSSIDNETQTITLTLPASKRTVTIQLMTHGIQKKIDREKQGLKKLKRDASVTTMLKHVITSIDGDDETKTIRHFVDNELFALDSRYMRNEIKKVTPDINLEIDCIDEEDGEPFRCAVDIGLDFFWPDSDL